MRVKLMTAVAMLAVTSAAGAWQAQRQPAPRAADAPRAYPAVQPLFEGYVQAKKMPGIVGAFGEGAAPPTFVAAGAIADDPGAAKATPDTLWRVYSMTKPITGMAAMMLIEDGKLRLDQPIGELIPAFRTMRVLTDPANSLASRPASTPITVRHLLTHTAGLGYSIVTKGPLLKEYERLGILPFTTNAQVETTLAGVRPKSLAEFADRVATLPLIAEPGTVWSYSIGLDLLGRVIEVASGMSFEDFLQRRMFGPLGMRSTYWTVPQTEAGRLATAYAWAGEARIPIDPGATSAYLKPPAFPYGGAGLVMSTRDYDRFLAMLANGGTVDGVRVMKPETVRLGMSNLLPNGVTFSGVAETTGGTPGGGMGFGAGGSVTLRDTPGGLSKGTYGWGGAAGTKAFVDPVRKLRATVMVNYIPSEKWPVRADVVRALYSKP
jgi:CubicO group peptidase (beta-lactamase class C family)